MTTQNTEYDIRAARFMIQHRKDALVENAKRVVDSLRRAADEFERDASRMFEGSPGDGGSYVSTEERLSWMINSVTWVFPNLPLAQMSLDSGRYASARDLLAYVDAQIHEPVESDSGP